MCYVEVVSDRKVKIIRIHRNVIQTLLRSTPAQYCNACIFCVPFIS